jgi:hypothetical protein
MTPLPLSFSNPERIAFYFAKTPFFSASYAGIPAHI